jgi:hypothetical protein
MIDSRSQSFLGENSENLIRSVRIGIVGLGGGGSHIVQQLAHVGVQDFLLIDPDRIEPRNLNRLVGAAIGDLDPPAFKTLIARRAITNLEPKAKIETRECKWQECLDELGSIDLLVGCVDGFINRRDLEAFCRRLLIPYVDIGMDVVCSSGHPPRMFGQVILSMPGYPCMKCLGFLSEAVLAREGRRYGDAGPAPQVVWSNGVLASTAVGIIVDLITDWSKGARRPIFLSYDGNSGEVKPDNRLQYTLAISCPHYPLPVT